MASENPLWPATVSRRSLRSLRSRPRSGAVIRQHGVSGRMPERSATTGTSLDGSSVLNTDFIDPAPQAASSRCRRASSFLWSRAGLRSRHTSTWSPPSTASTIRPLKVSGTGPLMPQPVKRTSPNPRPIVFPFRTAFTEVFLSVRPSRRPGHRSRVTRGTSAGRAGTTV